MTFNVGYLLVVVASMALGHLLFFTTAAQLGAARLETCCETASAAHASD
jgi:hypothetical protein